MGDGEGGSGDRVLDHWTEAPRHHALEHAIPALLIQASVLLPPSPAPPAPSSPFGPAVARLLHPDRYLHTPTHTPSHHQRLLYPPGLDSP